jgi:LmbE family N-acetylglucosaminyl deacetylase
MRVLAIGAHPDDIELGCAGALLRHVAAGDQVTMLVMTPGELGPQGITSRVREQEAAAAVLGVDLIWGPFHDGEIPTGKAAVAAIDEVVTRVGADVVYVHAPHDTHQDHVATSAAALSAARRMARVLYYQSPSTTSFDPTVFIDVESTISGKLAALRAHWSQVTQCPMVDLSAVEAGARYWGSRAKIGQAEAFETPRFVWDLVPASTTAEQSSIDEEFQALDAGLALAPGSSAPTSLDSAGPARRRARLVGLKP